MRMKTYFFIQNKCLCVLILAVCGALLFGLCSCSDLADADTDVKLRLCFLDVGQGDATLIRTVAGDILIDTGTEDSQEALCLRLGELGVERLSLLVLTHFDEDHAGGADGVLRQLAVDEIWINDSPSANESVTELYGALTDSGTVVTVVEKGMQRRVGDLLLTVLAPLYSGIEDGNEGSIVLKLSCGEISALLMGDVGVKTEEALVAQYSGAQLRCQLLKVGHHGSNTSTGSAFLEAARPQYAVISCGVGNEFGHPHGQPLQRLRKVGATVLRTDLLGEIIFVSDGEAIWQAGSAVLR